VAAIAEQTAGEARIEAIEAIARRFHERQLEDPPEQIAALIHPGAEMALVVNEFRSTLGRDQIVALLDDARHRMIYSAEVERCERIDESTLLLRGQARYAVERGLTPPSTGLTDFRMSSFGRCRRSARRRKRKQRTNRS
jgi:hypothetical protein